MKLAVMLTTVDNPFNPLTDWDDWYNYDESKGYYTSEYLARITKTSNELSDDDQDQAIIEAIDEIMEMNPDGFYKKVTDSE